MARMQAHGRERRVPLLLKLLGARWNNGDGTFRTRIGELTVKRGAGLAFDFGSYGEPHLHLAFIFLSWFVPLPRWTERFFGDDNHMERPRYGFSWPFRDGGELHLHWGRRTKVVWMPWMLEHIRTDYLGADGEWHDQRAEPGSFYCRHPNPRWRYDGPEGPAKWSETHPYRYMLDSGEVQEATATITRRRAFHGRRWFGSDPVSRVLRRLLAKRMFDSIDVEFDREMGARAGSWKGGTIGCSFDIRPEESPRAALMRMQRERRFR